MDLINLLGDSPIFIEAGSCDGCDSKWFLDNFKYIKLYCFEPDGRAVEIFKKNIKDDRCILYETALGNEDGVADFYECNGYPFKNDKEEWHKSSSIKKPKEHLINHPWCKFKDPKKVPVMKLDTWAKNNGINHIDFIWADVQGAEKELILGARNILYNTKFFYSEYSISEEYEGALNVDQIAQMLPDFSILEVLESDVLFKNRSMI